MKRVFLYVLLLIFIGSSVYPKVTLIASQNAFKLCLNTLFPSFLFPLIIVRLLSPYHVLTPFLKPLKKIIQFIFNMDIHTFEILCTSLFLGFPSSLLYLEEYTNTLNQKQYNRFMYCAFMASPSFIFISLSTIYPNKITTTLFCIQILSICILLICTRKIPLFLQIKTIQKDIQTLLKDAISRSFIIFGNILAYIVLIYVSIAILKTHIPTAIILPFQIVSEFASGCFLLNTLNIRIFYKVLFTSFLLSYGGLCVHLQILSLSSKRFEYKKFIQYRIAQICIVIFLTFLFI